MVWFPTIPGYHPSVTGQRPVNDGPGKGPTHVYGQVHRCGPRMARRWVYWAVTLGIMEPDYELVWTGPKRPVSGSPLGTLWQTALRECQNEANAEADRLNALDPEGRGGYT